MVYDSLTSDTETLTKVKLQQVDRLKKQLQGAMKTIGNLDERLTSIESMVNAALLKQQDDIKTLIAEVNALKGVQELEKASSRFDMDAKPAEPTGAPPVA
tara:strand:+ start:1796 stop:2095 length:300 start_codon:yes stop_codon:yes gene_type:complete